MQLHAKRSARKSSHFFSILMVVALAILSCFVIVACSGDGPGVNGNGSNDGNYNGKDNGNNNNNCNGVNNCNSYNSGQNGGGQINGGGGNSSGTTQQPQTSGSGPIAEGDFLYNPGAVSGPAIVEYWNGQGGASKICGTFELPSGESFNYNAGHWWKYASDQDMQAQWTEHVALYQQKADNAGCSIGQMP